MFAAFCGILVTIYYCLRFLWELIPISNISGRIVFITGCDSGFGRRICLKCLKNGMTVFAGCFSEKVGALHSLFNSNTLLIYLQKSDKALMSHTYIFCMKVPKK
uniref:Estradiol 17-beta-dehydrogenase 2 n=1 Tax=Ascaris lumbricoides TaxID=6252 RepID=A0A0M3IL56_ASCLU